MSLLPSLLSPQMSSSESIMSGNQSLCTHFTFVGLSSLAELQPVLFIVFLIQTSESSYLHLEEQGSEGSLSKPNTEEYCYTTGIKYSQDRNQETCGPRLCFYICSSTRKLWGFPSDSVVKSLLANKGDTGSISVSGRSHFLQSN